MDKAKQAAEARAILHQKLTDCANTLAQLAGMMATSAAELAQAAKVEHQATAEYVAELERKISLHRGEMSQ